MYILKKFFAIKRLMKLLNYPYRYTFEKEEYESLKLPSKSDCLLDKESLMIWNDEKNRYELSDVAVKYFDDVQRFIIQVAIGLATFVVALITLIITIV